MLHKDDEVLLSRKEASRELATLGIHLAPSTLAKLLCGGRDAPPCTHIRKRAYYAKSQLHLWARSQISELRSSSRIEPSSDF